MVGKPIELIGQTLPAFASQAIATATSKGRELALKVALQIEKFPVLFPVSRDLDAEAGSMYTVSATTFSLGRTSGLK
jgi:hypothetical protein